MLLLEAIRAAASRSSQFAAAAFPHSSSARPRASLPHSRGSGSDWVRCSRSRPARLVAHILMTHRLADHRAETSHRPWLGCSQLPRDRCDGQCRAVFFNESQQRCLRGAGYGQHCAIPSCPRPVVYANRVCRRHPSAWGSSNRDGSDSTRKATFKSIMPSTSSRSSDSEESVQASRTWPRLSQLHRRNRSYPSSPTLHLRHRPSVPSL
jgi:hypothetical protein